MREGFFILFIFARTWKPLISSLLGPFEWFWWFIGYTFKLVLKNLCLVFTANLQGDYAALSYEARSASYPIFLFYSFVFFCLACRLYQKLIWSCGMPQLSCSSLKMMKKAATRTMFLLALLKSECIFYVQENNFWRRCSGVWDCTWPRILPLVWKEVPWRACMLSSHPNVSDRQIIYHSKDQSVPPLQRGFIRSFTASDTVLHLYGQVPVSYQTSKLAEADTEEFNFCPQNAQSAISLGWIFDLFLKWHSPVGLFIFE